MTVGRWFPGRYIVEGAGWNNGTLAVAGSVRNRTIAIAADLAREAFCFRQIESLD